MATHQDDVTAQEVVDVLREIDNLNHGVIPESERQRVMARKRALVDRIEPGFYDRHPASDTDDPPSMRLLSETVRDLAESVLRKMLHEAERWGGHFDPDGGVVDVSNLRFSENERVYLEALRIYVQLDIEAGVRAPHADPAPDPIRGDDVP